MPALGERFRAAREARGLTVSDVAEHIRIRSVYLTAIEDENWPAIGAPVYTRGFIRSYARYLGLDPEELVAQFNVASGAAASPSQVASAERSASLPRDAKVDSPAHRRSFSPLLWIAGVVALVLVGFVVYNLLALHEFSAGTTVAQATATPLATPSGVPSASPTPAVAPHTLVITLTAASWLRVTVDGSVSMEGTFPAGTTKTFHGKVVLVRAGNAGGVTASVNGGSPVKFGNVSDVVDRSFTL